MREKFFWSVCMPELPEVETLCRQLREIVLNEEIRGFEVRDAKIGAVSGFTGRKIFSVTRDGKTLVIQLDDDTELLLHLRMTGRLLWQVHHQKVIPYTRFVIIFPHGNLFCIDPRRFATLAIQKNGSGKAIISDPLQTCWAPVLHEISCTRKMPVKSFIMDQRVIAGIGNIYASEILHEAAIDPMRSTCKVTLRELEALSWAGRNILQRAIDCRGTSVSDWRDLFGSRGEYQNELKVYRRESLPCLRCGCTIKRIRVSGRGTYFCAHCQQ